MLATLVNPSNISGHRSLYLWWCSSGHKNEGSDRDCRVCANSRIERHAQIHSSERAVCYRNPATGEIRRPPRADMPMDQKYIDQGYVREEIMSMIQHERETGSVHEDTNFLPGNEPVPEMTPTPSCPKEVKEALIRDVMDAHQSGNWTNDNPLRTEV